MIKDAWCNFEKFDCIYIIMVQILMIKRKENESLMVLNELCVYVNKSAYLVDFV